ncbi:sufurtransferase FdhD [Paramagnetospirillum marisnigri]|uniref:Sulfur carrier protein FdhD n=1 Tax=Paramagnetospirillum marisnigri TaxID=1285242 RepID=A0A178M7G7_9PROT|nr:formate dehydrogenase accessory sulfurtransferase FdhD [Paramagnetospirillum marisnigri]OAN44721.1 sufurtransferase FdhD [Paramagnetospirillum marisnigri]
MSAASMDHPLAAEGHSPPATAAMAEVVVERWCAGIAEDGLDWAAAELPVSLDYNGLSHAVMLASPADLEDFALGFSLTEAIVTRPGDILDLSVSTVANGIRVEMRIPERRFHALKQRRRSLAGRTGCGLCGTESLAQVFRPMAPVRSRASLEPQAIQRGFVDLAAAQDLQRWTGATHAAGWIDAQGRMSLSREDVGRHNALDKLIGALAARGEDLGSGAVVITSRASSEMVQKAASVGIGILAAISAPTLTAIELARDLDLTLLGFARQNRHVLYAGPQRIRRGEPS